MCFPTTAVASKKNKNEEKKTNLFNKATIILTKVIVYLSLRVGCFLLFFRTDAQISSCTGVGPSCPLFLTVLQSQDSEKNVQ